MQAFGIRSRAEIFCTHARIHSELVPVMYRVLIRLVIINLFVKSSDDETRIRLLYFNVRLDLQIKSLDCDYLFHFLGISNGQTNL